MTFFLRVLFVWILAGSLIVQAQPLSDEENALLAERLLEIYELIESLPKPQEAAWITDGDCYNLISDLQNKLQEIAEDFPNANIDIEIEVFVSIRETCEDLTGRAIRIPPKPLNGPYVKLAATAGGTFSPPASSQTHGVDGWINEFDINHPSARFVASFGYTFGESHFTGSTGSALQFEIEGLRNLSGAPNGSYVGNGKNSLGEYYITAIEGPRQEHNIDNFSESQVSANIYRTFYDSDGTITTAFGVGMGRVSRNFSYSTNTEENPSEKWIDTNGEYRSLYLPITFKIALYPLGTSGRVSFGVGFILQARFNFIRDYNGTLQNEAGDMRSYTLSRSRLEKAIIWDVHLLFR